MPEQTNSRAFGFKRAMRRVPVAVAVAVALALAVRATVAEEFRVTGSCVEPEVPKDARVLVYKLARSFAPHDIIIYRDATGENRAGRVVSADGAGLVVGRTGSPDARVPRDRVVGRVVVSTR